jgi:hypothetical protein
MFCIRGLRQGCSLFLVGKPKNFRYTALIRSNTHRYWRCAGPFRLDIRLKLVFQNLGLHGVQNSLMREVASRLDHALAREVRVARQCASTRGPQSEDAPFFFCAEEGPNFEWLPAVNSCITPVNSLLVFVCAEF